GVGACRTSTRVVGAVSSVGRRVVGRVVRRRRALKGGAGGSVRTRRARRGASVAHRLQRRRLRRGGIAGDVPVSRRCCRGANRTCRTLVWWVVGAPGGARAAASRAGTLPVRWIPAPGSGVQPSRRAVRRRVAAGWL